MAVFFPEVFWQRGEGESRARAGLVATDHFNKAQMDKEVFFWPLVLLNKCHVLVSHRTFHCLHSFGSRKPSAAGKSLFISRIHPQFKGLLMPQSPKWPRGPR